MAQTPGHSEPMAAGTHQAPVRRLKATIIGDLVGYSRLIEKDDLGTLDRIAELKRDVIQPQLQGYRAWTRWSAGDRLLALFDSVVDAVECACRIQSALAAKSRDLPDNESVHMRIGISFGDVILEEDDAAGESVNIAARLEGLCEPGGLAISESAYLEVHHKIPLAYEDYGERRLKNLAEPVRVYRVRAKDVGQRSSTDAYVRTRARQRWRRMFTGPRLAFGSLALLMVGGLVLMFLAGDLDRFWTAGDAPQENAIAVLPFENLNRDPAQDHIARGIATDLIIDLSGVEAASVVARSSSFRYEGRPVDLREVADMLGVKYVVDGTVLRVADNIRVNVSLIDAQSERQVWASRFDGSTTELFQFQSQMALKVLEALQINIAQVETPAQRPPPDFAVTDVFYEAREAYFRDDPGQLATARRLLDQILQADPGFKAAHAYLAAIFWAGFDEDWAPQLGLTPPESLDLAWRHLEVSLADPLPLTYQVQARILAWEGDFDAALQAAENALRLGPNDPIGRLTMGMMLIYNGAPDDALRFIERAAGSDPLNLGDYLFWQGMARYLADDLSGAERVLRQSVEINKNDDWGYLVLAAALGQQGKEDDARRALESVQSLRREAGASVYGLRDVKYWAFQRAADRRRLCDGLAKAGLSGSCE